ncbi:acyltransferase [Telmatospirillum sp. J64-1]|uniref:acyltransferase family protein n=1 Tax=Telmatospirillum sp. J64-1 TaxID=2502183 RepID=UPI00115DE11A|nr:acyltransferase [Telmatospirillum sp. J64-1]
MRQHITQLDSVRGLAALAVAFSHCLLVFSIGDSRTYWLETLTLETNSQVWLFRIINAAFNDTAAVILFFVLSGFVLTLSLREKEQGLRHYLGFAVQRLLRLWPAMAVSVVLTYAVITLFHFPPVGEEFSEWFTLLFLTPPTLPTTGLNLLLIKTDVNVVTWTIYVEIWGSLALPFLLISFHRVFKGRALPFLAGLLLLAVAAHRHPELRYLYCFAIGICIALQGPPSLLVRHARQAVALGLAIFFVSDLVLGSYFQKQVAAAAGSFLILAAIAGAPERFALLSSPFLNALGRISYSFYLLHLSVFYFTSWLFVSLGFSGEMANLLIALFSIPLTLPLAFACYRLVEMPSMALGRRLGSRIGAQPLPAPPSPQGGAPVKRGYEETSSRSK